MSRFTVKFTERAKNDFNAACDWYEKQSTSSVEKWIDAVGLMLDQLEHDPCRFPRANDDGILPVPLQECYFGAGHRRTHRFVYTVRPNRLVIVYAIRHLAQHTLSPGDI